MNKILIAEDDDAIVRSLADFLTAEGFSVVSAKCEKDAVKLLGSGSVDLVLMDLGLAEGSGYNAGRAAKLLKIPVIFLTASADEDSIVKGLDIGDDYIIKPFRPRELLSRIKNVLRRSEKGSSVVLLACGVSVDTERAGVYKNGTQIGLSALEYKLLLIFVDNRGRVLTRNQLLENIWDIGGDFVNDNTLTVYIKRLREKIEDDPADPKIITTVRGIGYRMD